MNPATTHIILQQHLDVTFMGQASEGQPLQQKMAALCTQYLLPALDRILDRFSSVREHIYIDHLEVDLGEIQLHDLDEKLVHVFIEKMEERISVLAKQVIPITNETIFEDTTGMVQIVDQETAILQAFIHFLHTGRLPWNYRLPENKTLDQLVLEILQGPDRETHLHQILETIQFHGARHRLVIQVSSKVLEKIMHLHAPILALEVTHLLEIFSGNEFAFLSEKIKEGAAGILSSGLTAFSPAIVLEQAIHLLSSDPRPEVRIIIEKTLHVAEKHQIRVSQLHSEKAHAIQDESIESRPSISKYHTGTESIYIDNAGLILLHPFLPALFEGTGILNENIIVDPYRALQLLHYLCTGHLEAPEYLLTFSKVICGIPLETPVPSSIPLHPGDIEEADALLDAVIHHWTALQNTSRDGLRGTFLLRPGKLSTAFDGGWLLQVERQSFDILLDNLPWSYGIVKLPWLPNLIHIEW